jgi:hypothetical protein
MERVTRGLYKHAKSDRFYSVIAVGTHTETDEEVVVYYPKDSPDKVYVRPLDQFDEEVRFTKSNGLIYEGKRFIRV